MRDRLRAAYSSYTPQAIDHDPSLWPAAVLFLLYEHEGRVHTVFQKRTHTVDAHKGQISLPGGGKDAEDPHLLHTALRETHEEIGVEPGHIEILGQLDQARSISNFAVTPYVGWLERYPYEWRFSHAEVARLIEVPVDHLLDPANFVPDRRLVNGRQVVMPSYQFGDDLIWGLTGRFVANFLDVWQTATES